MGKRKHIKAGAGDVVQKPVALVAQVEGEGKAKHREQPRGAQKAAREDPEFVPDKMSERILALAAEQREEEAHEDASDDFTRNVSARRACVDSEEGEESDDEASDVDESKSHVKSGIRKLLHEAEGVNSLASRPRKRARLNTATEADDDDEPLDAALTAGLSTNVVHMFREIGAYMSRYRSGNIPKAFKSIPALQNWEQILELTHPEKYSAAAMLHATRMFSATASPKSCERFYRFYLLPRCMDDIMEFRKVNVHLFGALKKAAYKPEAFVKGVVLPWAESDAFSMTSAHVLRAVLHAISLPVFHAAAAMIKLARLPISGPVSYVLAGMIKKRYSLPSLAIDALIRYFRSYADDEPMQLSLNSCIAVLVELYRNDLTDEQKAQLAELLQSKGHELAREPILKQLRGEAPPPEDVQMDEKDKDDDEEGLFDDAEEAWEDDDELEEDEE